MPYENKQPRTSICWDGTDGMRDDRACVTERVRACVGRDSGFVARKGVELRTRGARGEDCAVDANLSNTM